MKEPLVLVVGDANVDLVIYLPERTAAPLDLSCSVPQLCGGGSAANTAVALARLGTRVAFAGSIGDDGYGRWARDDLRSEQINIEGMRLIPDAFTLMALAIIQPDGERQIVVWPASGGAHTAYRPEDLNSEMVAKAAWLHTSGICLRYPPVCEAVLYAMQLAQQAGVPISLDLNLRIETFGLNEADRERFWQAIRLSEVVFGSAAEEIMPLAGKNTVEESAETLSEGLRTVVARLGPKGALAAAPGVNLYAPAFSLPVVDTLGAGDAFNAGFIAAHLAGRDLAGCLRWGNATAALKIGQPGARGLPGRAEVAALAGRK